MASVPRAMIKMVVTAAGRRQAATTAAGQRGGGSSAGGSGASQGGRSSQRREVHDLVPSAAETWVAYSLPMVAVLILLSGGPHLAKN
ncbi:hypothetical protein C2845_PM09G20510 [Panicum miliaceum]|uniref:Uncharacterized protein n=1 Tax=Panicum miliaceum TaxID=4540 RepID=A0A3L6S5E6_PANMI|nr:hypothetical protein C2845_PM09G20510 [Panicum miliaceum]